MQANDIFYTQYIIELTTFNRTFVPFSMVDSHVYASRQ